MQDSQARQQDLFSQVALASATQEQGLDIATLLQELQETTLRLQEARRQVAPCMSCNLSDVHVEWLASVFPGSLTTSADCSLGLLRGSICLT